MKQKLLLLTLIVLLTAQSFAQAPESMNYQAVLRNNAGVVLAGQGIDVRFTIRENGALGAIAYQEEQTLTTNQFGLFTAAIGGGIVLSGSFPGISWGTNPHYLEVEFSLN